MNDPIKRTDVSFEVDYVGKSKVLTGTLYTPQVVSGAKPVPVIFTSGFTGGVAMYGQLFSREFASLGYAVLTYDVGGFYTNKKAGKHAKSEDGKLITDVSLNDQERELLAAIRWMKIKFGTNPILISWAMGSVVNLGTIASMCSQNMEPVPLSVLLSYTKMKNLQGLRKDQNNADKEIRKLDVFNAIPPFDVGTNETELGFYPLDVDTQKYVHKQLGTYTREGGVENWPGIELVSAQSYKETVEYDPEQRLLDLSRSNGKKFKPAKVLIIHGEKNTLHLPSESIRLSRVYPGEVVNGKAMLIQNMRHGQELELKNPVYEEIIRMIDGTITENCVEKLEEKEYRIKTICDVNLIMKGVQIVLVYQRKSLLDIPEEREFITKQIVEGFLPRYEQRMKLVYVLCEDGEKVKRFTRFDYRVWAFNFNTVRFKKIEKTFYVKLKSLKEGEDVRKRSMKFSKKILQRILWMMTKDGRAIVFKRGLKIKENSPSLNIILGKKKFLYAPCTSPGKNLILLHLKVRNENSRNDDSIFVELSVEQHDTNRMIMQACGNDSTKVILFSFDPKTNKEFIKKVLYEGVKIRYDDTDHTFFYFGCSGSQLKNNECFLLDTNDRSSILPLIKEFIHLDQLSPLISKKTARIGLLFSKVKEYIDLNKFSENDEVLVEEIEDVERNGHIFTDGNGFISFYFAHEIATKFLGLDYTPSVFQIRYLGYKGVLNVKKFSREGVKKPRILQFRKSMKKFDSPPKILNRYNLLGICDYSKPSRFSFINQQIIQLLSGLGVRDEVFLKLQEDYFDRLLSVFFNFDEKSFRFFCDFLVYNDEIETLHHLIKTYEEERYNDGIDRVKFSSFSEQNERMKLKHVKKNIIDMELKKLKLRIPCFQSRIVFGIADFTGSLRRNEVYVRVSLSPGRIQTIVGKVVVGKNPCYYPGDIKVLNAVDLNIPILFDCIVFSVHGNVPIVHDMSGSDLDGDMYFVCWKNEMIPIFTHKSYSYSASLSSSSKKEDENPNQEELKSYVNHFVDFNRGILGYIDYCYNYWCNKEGVMSEKCKLLGTRYFSKAVDSSKTGAKVRLPKQLVPPKRKDGSSSLELQLKELNENMIHSKLKIRNIKFFRDNFQDRNIRQQQQQQRFVSIPDHFFLDLLSIPFYSDYEIFSLLLSYDRHIGLQSYSINELFEYFDYSRFSSDEIKIALSNGVNKSLILNGINLSSILSKREIGCSRIIEGNKFWKLYSRDDQKTFNFMKLCDALRKYKKVVMIFQTLETEKILIHVSKTNDRLSNDHNYLQYDNNNNVDGQIDVWYFKGDRLFYKSNLKSKKRKSKNEKFRLYFNTNKLQIFDEHESQSFLWMKDDRNRKRMHNQEEGKVRMSINLNEFNQNLVRNRGRLNKHPWIQAEVYVSQEPIYQEDRFHLESNIYSSGNDGEDKEIENRYTIGKKILDEKLKVYLDLKEKKVKELIKMIDEEKKNIETNHPHLLNRKEILLNSRVTDYLFQCSNEVFLGDVFSRIVTSDQDVNFPRLKLNRQDLPFLVTYFADNYMFEECIRFAGFDKKKVTSENENETSLFLDLWKIYFSRVHLSKNSDILKKTFRIMKKKPVITLFKFSSDDEYIDSVIKYICTLIIWNLDSVAFELMDLIFYNREMDGGDNNLFYRIFRKNKNMSQLLFSLILMQEKEEERKLLTLEIFFEKYISKFNDCEEEEVEEEEEEECEGEEGEDSESEEEEEEESNNTIRRRKKGYNPFKLFEYYAKLLIRETWFELPENKNRRRSPGSCATLSFVGDEKSLKTVIIQTV